MKSKIVVGVILGFFFVTACFGDPNTEIRYSVTDLGSDQWEYIYTVENIGLIEGIEEFTIWFGFDEYDNLLYDDLVVTTPETPAGWDQIVWDPEPVLLDDGAYDAVTLTVGIGQGENVSGFSVSFDWLGIGEPGSQYYEIINPVTFETIEDGYTVPEPATLFLLGFGGLVLLGRRRACN